MSSLKNDIISLLKYYVDRESEEEKRLIDDQKRYGLKVCLYVHHNRNSTKDGGNDIITIHTKLNQLNKISDNLEYEDISDQFYIKSQKVSHRTRMSSSHNYVNGHIISIETVVTKSYSKCETVFKTFITKTDNGKRQQTQRSFTREVFKCQHSLKNNNELHRCLSKPQECDNDNIIHYNSYRNTGDTDNIHENKSNNADKPDKPKLKKISSFNKVKNFTVKKDIDNKNINNVEKLEPMKKARKSIRKRFKDWFSKSSILIPDSANISTNLNHTRKKSLIDIQRCISTEDSEMDKEKPTNIIARISMDAETKKFEIIKDDMPYIDEEEDEQNISECKSESMSFSESYCNFNFPSFNEIKRKDKNEICECDKRRKEAMIKYILSRLDKKEIDNEEINKFDDKTEHFIDCPNFVISPPSDRISSKFSSTSSPNNLSPYDNTISIRRRGSVISIHSESHLDTVFENLKFSNEIHCPIETINYFINSKDYDHYENGLLKVLDTKVSLENMILFFYLTRVIIKQIDDPGCDDNDDIKRIMTFSENFLIKSYHSEISKHGDLEKFILHCDNVD